MSDQRLKEASKHVLGIIFDELKYLEKFEGDISLRRDLRELLGIELLEAVKYIESLNYEVHQVIVMRIDIIFTLRQNNQYRKLSS